MIPAPTPPIAPPETTPAEADEKPSPTGRRQTVAFGPHGEQFYRSSGRFNKKMNGTKNQSGDM
jgi:hypothetical protein